MNNQPRRSIVMGASIAGLWAARVLADHFDEVLILERDSLPEGPEPRGGVPQSRQYHIMLLKGLQLMDDLFPGLRDELIEAGAIPFDTINDVAVRSRGNWLPRFHSDQYLLSCSRLLLEAGIRRHLRRWDRVRFVENVNVTGLETDAQAQRIVGVHVTHRHDNDRAETFTADLIVDALGRRSPTPEWLTALGYTAPAESSVNSFLGYVTRRYRIPDNFQADWRMLMILATPPDQPRGGLIFPEENGVWCVMMAGANKDYPPTDDDGFVDFARSLGTEFHRAVQAAEPLTQAYGYRGTESRRRHYEKLTRWPDRYVVLGDAFCGFNPVYGQGMTVAAMSAVAMGDAIRRAGGNLDGLAQPLLRQISTITDGAWLLATSADKDWPETVGGAQKSGLFDRFGSWYIGQLLEATAKDPALRLAFLEVNQLIKPATSLFAPGVMLRVFRQGLGRR
jgi:2-polyprenyl-6-methoxyphenol hydroxylase-like FAD-dependent oxidoreductase